MAKESFIFYKSFLDALEELPDNLRLKLYDAITKYALKGEEIELSGIEKAVFLLIKPQINANHQKYENGCKGAEFGHLGGRPKKPQENPKETPAKTPKKPQRNPKETPNENDKEHEEESLYDSYKKIESENGKYYYYFGIIDYLTEFNFRKTLENSFKNLFVSQSDKDKFSAIKPGPYQVRFFDFLRTHVFVKERDKRGKLIHKNLK